MLKRNSLASTFSASSPGNGGPGDQHNEVDQIRSAERVQEIYEVIGLISNNLAIPLYLVFWVCDLIYVPQYKWPFLCLRLLTVPLCLTVRKYIRRISSYFYAQLLCAFFISILATIINLMIFIIGDIATPYYAGLNLVALGTLAFIPWSKRFYLILATAIYLPYFAFGFIKMGTITDLQPVMVHSFFIVGTILISIIMRNFNESLREKEVKSRLALKAEIISRDSIIEVKAKEAVKLTNLSKQFSPQVIEAITSGRVPFEVGIKRSSICVIYIDIVGFTEKVNRLDHSKVAKVLSMFMEDSIKIFLKYDLTIDKFIGDCALAFANEPVKYADYVERTLLAALEIQQTILMRQEEYDEYWEGEFRIRSGIDVSFAGVGFYGTDKYFKSYTAIGRSMNLANRICGAAEPNQILVSNDTLKMLKDDNFKTNLVGSKSFKGFLDDVIKVHELLGAKNQIGPKLGVEECKKCGKILTLVTNSRGIYEFKCVSCGLVASSSSQATSSKKAAS